MGLWPDVGADGRPQDGRARHLGGPLAPGARRRRDRDRHRDLRGPAGARSRAERQPAAGPHPAAHRERHLHHGEPGPRGAGARARLRVPVRRAAPSRSAAPPGRWSIPSPSSEGVNQRDRDHGGARRPRAEQARDPGSPDPDARPERGARPRARRLDLRHRRAPDPWRLPRLLAARLPVHPRPRMGRRDRGPRARAPSCSAGRWATGSRAPRTTRAASARSASRATTTCARTTAGSASTSSTATASRAPTPRTSSTA